MIEFCDRRDSKKGTHLQSPGSCPSYFPRSVRWRVIWRACSSICFAAPATRRPSNFRHFRYCRLGGLPNDTSLRRARGIDEECWARGPEVRGGVPKICPDSPVQSADSDQDRCNKRLSMWRGHNFAVPDFGIVFPTPTKRPIGRARSPHPRIAKRKGRRTRNVFHRAL